MNSKVDEMAKLKVVSTLETKSLLKCIVNHTACGHLLLVYYLGFLLYHVKFY